MAANTPATASIRVALGLSFSAAEVAEYLCKPEVVRYWLGSDCQLSPVLGSTARLPHAQSSQPPHRRISHEYAKSGKVVALVWPDGNRAVAAVGSYEIVVALDDAPAVSRVTMRISPRPDGTCRLRIQHTGLADDGQRHASVKVWQGALRRVGRLVHEAQRNRRHERQAVIVVHGIGEQRPGQLLREFVANVFDRDAGEIHFVKPDQVSALFEMRMATVPRNEAKRPTTDVYELYWAHLIRDTTLAQVYVWLLGLVLSRDSRIPQTLIRLVWLARMSLVTALAAFVWLTGQDVSGWLKGIGGGVLVALPAIASFVLKALGHEFVVGYAGDAARYLEPRAGNVARRQEIREAGARLLDGLHDKGRYSRIVVYGHSLGSVIAYDIVSHAWARSSRNRDPVARTSSRALLALEDVLNPRPGRGGDPPAIEQIQAMQHEAWLEYQRNGFQWRISDLVTTGSPLAHARWLLNLDATTPFSELVAERSFPICPPQTERARTPVADVYREAFTFTHAYGDPGNPHKTRSVQVPHHGGLFALTRWTNLYFPYEGLIHGDPVGGALAGCFGDWVRDVRLPQTRGFAHGRYTDRALEPEAVAQVRSALNLPFGRPLVDYAPAAPHPSVLG